MSARPKRADRQRIGHELSDGVWRWLVGDWTIAEMREAGDPDAFETFLMPDEEQRALWEQHREIALRHVTKNTPGKRPPLWWEYDARSRGGG